MSSVIPIAPTPPKTVAAAIDSPESRAPGIVVLQPEHRREDLPEEIYWLTEQVEKLIRPGLFHFQAPSTRRSAKSVPLPERAPMGSTGCFGKPDLPADAPWVKSSAADWRQSPYDGESFWFQLNLEEIPQVVRKPEWPAVGVVWVFIDLSGRLQDESRKDGIAWREGPWRAIAQFDPRSAKDIPWMKRQVTGSRVTSQASAQLPEKTVFQMLPTVPYATQATLTEICWVDYALDPYEAWADKNFREAHHRADLQIGGWMSPVQGDYDERNADFVCGMFNCEIGDCGSVCLHYNLEQGFYAIVDTH